MMKTPFEQGQIDGQWTVEQVRACGFTSAEKCLEHQEHAYQEELGQLSGLAAQHPHLRYLEGLITATRASLRALFPDEAARCEACGALFHPSTGYVGPDYCYCSLCCHW